MPVPVELLRFFDKFTPSSGTGPERSAADSASLGDYSDTAIAQVEAEAEIGGAAAGKLEIPDVPEIPELSAAEKGERPATETSAPEPAPAEIPPPGELAADPATGRAASADGGAQKS
jgi:hypothetical protein